ncbi:SGNH/GDSL hydrolase family protein [Burkholderia vietnamiensis]|uniref:SGNH/GDSL hydrolase family protein n=1 Tax=Burkholderia vietnamiensis TaxID=60552 RepID=UPI001B8E00A7|nr:SGNH/GDSL hydrolase family protein [Burkholderia vietnamiensis]MBR8084573.1 SGNH/GDSL hydrolase family protein [Burkholderia vietnamiensis]
MLCKLFQLRVALICLWCALSSPMAVAQRMWMTESSDPIMHIIGSGQRSILNDLEVASRLAGGVSIHGASPAYTTEQKLERGEGNVCIVISGDSTTAGSHRWPHKLAVWLASRFPGYSTTFDVWHDDKKKYLPEPISSHAGHVKLDVYNAGVAGTQPHYLFGQDFGGTYGPCDADLVFISHGHNDDQNAPIEVHRGMLLAAIQEIAISQPKAGIVVVAENPLRDSEGGTARSVGAMSAALSMGYGLVDAFSMFELAGKPKAWYQDNVHPSDAGDSKIAEMVQTMFSSATSQSVAKAPTLAEKVPNLLRNGDFSRWNGSQPDMWMADGVASFMAAPGRGSSRQECRIESLGQKMFANIYQELPLAQVIQLRGRWVTLAVREWVEGTTDDANAGAIAIVSKGATRSYGIPRGGRDGYRWLAVSRFIEPDALSVRVQLFATLSNKSGVRAFFDRAVLVPGTLPYNMIDGRG